MSTTASGPLNVSVPELTIVISQSHTPSGLQAACAARVMIVTVRQRTSLHLLVVAGTAFARMPDLDVADMAFDFGIVEVAVEIDEPAAERRLVGGRTSDVAVIWTPCTESGPPAASCSWIAGSWLVAQSVAGLDQRVAAGVEIEVALVVIAILQVEPAGRLAVSRRKADRIFLRCLAPRCFRRRIVGALAPVAQHFALSGIGELAVVVAVLDVAALRQIHEAARIEGDVGDRIVLVGLDRQLPARIVGEAAVVVDADRPDFGFIADRIVDAAAMRLDRPDAALVLREAPAVGVLAVEVRALDVHHRAVVGDRSQAVRRAPGDAVVERVDQRAVGADAMDQAGVEVGGEATGGSPRRS